MIVDSTALPEQAVRDILASAFQSAGQRCSALRVLYLQDDIAAPFLTMLFGAMDQLQVGDPRDFATDCGPVIDETAKQKIDAHIGKAEHEGRLLKQLGTPNEGTFVGPAVISVNGIGDLEEEIFGPVLHVATYKAEELDAVIDAINATGYGLTFGLHSRIDDKVQHIVDRVEAGNIYINRNQIGAVVGSQPFGSGGLSGTGPKAGGPRYLHRFLKVEPMAGEPVDGATVTVAEIEGAFKDNGTKSNEAIETIDLPGPTGESNRCTTYPRGRVLCLGPSAAEAEEQAKRAAALGCNSVAAAPGVKTGCDGMVLPATLTDISELDAVICWSKDAGKYRAALATRDGRIVPLLTEHDFERWLIAERHVCIDTTAAGGDAALMGG